MKHLINMMILMSAVLIFACSSNNKNNNTDSEIDDNDKNSTDSEINDEHIADDDQTDDNSDLSDDIKEDLENNNDFENNENPDKSDDDSVESSCGSGSALIDPLTCCKPSVTSCEAMSEPVNSAIYASFRKDFYYEHYSEGDLTNPNPAPLDGGRFHITGISAVTGKVTALKINGVNVDDIIAQKKMVWAAPYPFDVKAGEQIWVSFHSQEKSWDTDKTATVTVETDNGNALNGTFPVNRIEIPFTFVTTSENYSELIMHVHNRTGISQKLEKLFYNGYDITDAACIPEKIIPAGQSAMWTFDLCEPAEPGDLWTVTAEFDKAVPSTAGGRIIREFYPVETWQSTSDCPFPNSNNNNYLRNREAGIDTFYLHGGTGNTCGFNNIDLVENVSIENDFWIMAERNVMKTAEGNRAISKTDRVAAYFAGDESDTRIYNSEGEYATVPYEKYKNHTEFSWKNYPEIPVYLGGSRHRYTGAFAGCTDIQGFDFYIAACAPHITVVEANMPPLRAAFDMLLSVRENHMPLPTWLYSQALGTMWEITWPPLVGTEKFKRVPNAMEQRLSIASVLAAGAKGMMYFQTNMALADANPATWDEIKGMGKDIKGLRKFLRVADFGNPLATDENTVATLLRGEEILILVVINLANTGPLTEAACQTVKDPHWKLVDSFPTVTFDIPSDIGIEEMFEVRNGTISDINYASIDKLQRKATLTGIPLSDAIPSRIFVFAANKEIKTEISNSF